MDNKKINYSQVPSSDLIKRINNPKEEYVELTAIKNPPQAAVLDFQKKSFKALHIQMKDVLIIKAIGPELFKSLAPEKKASFHRTSKDLKFKGGRRRNGN